MNDALKVSLACGIGLMVGCVINIHSDILAQKEAKELRTINLDLQAKVFRLEDTLFQGQVILSELRAKNEELTEATQVLTAENKILYNEVVYMKEYVRKK